MNRLKICIIGDGAHGRSHGQSYTEIPEAEILAITD